jgi:hypothetical protein
VIMLDHSLDSRKSKPGQRIVARVALEVPLENKHVIRAESKYSEKSRRWKMAAAERNSAGASTGLCWAKPRSRSAPRCEPYPLPGLSTVPRWNTVPASDQYPRSAATTTQIGGDVVYRGNGTVENEMAKWLASPFITVVCLPR